MRTLLKVLVLVGMCFSLPSCEVVAVAAALSNLAAQPYDRYEPYHRPQYPNSYRYAPTYTQPDPVIGIDPWDVVEDEPDDCPIY